MQFTFFLHYIHLSCWIQVWLNWSKSCGANGPTHLNLMIWHSHRHHWYLFGKLKKSVNINITLLILCIYYISKWIWPFWLFWAIIASLTSRFDIRMPASKTRWFGSVLTVVVVYFIAQSILEGKKFGSLDFFSQKNRHDVRLHCTKYLYFH